jgi:hypothetical protein
MKYTGCYGERIFPLFLNYKLTQKIEYVDVLRKNVQTINKQSIEYMIEYN